MKKDINIKSNFIGKNLKVSDSKNKSLVGLFGTIVDETKFSFIIKGKNFKKRILKKDSFFLIDKTSITGDEITGSCIQRLKK